ncbi:DUF924 domain-containing protein (plasmid) [Pseudorhodobacter turbinis]|uniref:DUF924 domain-containing protein n=1 Tax=Pseudorhodobacter turbinis TaxID=2500533 RepID=A0A4P8EIW6_9RHOB|nr:DUF924 family protein [Pseudorhodobacter turbinis]QCO56782.1 DUF924 domain-containing protein [Pseudorhodobacter turbinis]
MSDPMEVLDFWLQKVGVKGWYEVDPAVDAEITDRFGDLWQAAHEGGLDHWIAGAAGTLAFLIVTDQFPRNMFRGDPRAFATDPRARDAARRALAENWDQDAPTPERQFFYLPFEHSEDAADQALAVECFSTRMDSPESALHARAHQRIIQTFGRFPFRNVALGRKSTKEEEAFMAEGGYGAIVRALQGERS